MINENITSISLKYASFPTRTYPIHIKKFHLCTNAAWNLTLMNLTNFKELGNTTSHVPIFLKIQNCSGSSGNNLYNEITY